MIPVKEEIDLHRLTLDEALPKLDDFLHAAFQAGLYRVWVVHGKGSGVLRARKLDITYQNIRW